MMKRSEVLHNLARFCLLMLLVLATVAAFASGDGGHADSGVVLKDFLYRCFNFALLVGLLAYFVRKPIREGLTSRREGIKKTLADAEEAKEAGRWEIRNIVFHDISYFMGDFSGRIIWDLSDRRKRLLLGFLILGWLLDAKFFDPGAKRVGMHPQG